MRVVATVNNHPITRSELGHECLRHYGKKVLESLVNKRLISQECKRRQITITRAEVNGEITRMARRFSLPTDRWLKLLEQERGINPSQYAADIIWPMLALRKLAGDQLKVSPAELFELYEIRYGSAVCVRAIFCKNPEKAQGARAQAVANPDQFSKLAKRYSEDASASAGGLIQPIRKHGRYRQVEQAAFTMADGQISQVIPAGGQYVVLKRERLLPARQVKFEDVAPRLEAVIRDQKMRSVSSQVFRKLQEGSKVQNVFNDPVASRRMPGVAAVINGHQVTIRELAEQCIQRHGIEVLEGTINRKLLELDCKKHNITVTEAELDREILRAASESLKPKPDGSPDVEGWLKAVTQRQDISVELYRRDSVWPSVALKKLVGDSVKVTDEDLQKGFEANYGPRVRCRAIVMNNLRRAQEVWEMARGNPTLEYFGDLAEQYSIEGPSRAMRGEVPPVQKHGGQPLLEKEAFSLKPGELSGIVQVGDVYIILFCEGHTPTAEVTFEEVRDDIYQHVHQKKLRLAMAKYFRRLQETAQIDNFLAGTTQSSKKSANAGPLGNIPTLRQVPQDTLRRR